MPFLVSMFTQGCATTGLATVTNEIIAADDQFIILFANRGDTLQSLAKRYLKDKNRDWEIAEFNNVEALSPGQIIVVPLQSTNPSGVYTKGYQTVPVLCYHRFGNGHAKLSVSAADFQAQMDYLKNNDYRVIPLTDLIEFIKGNKAVPKRTVVITVDDGYKSTYEKAFPILQKHNFPATIFLYTGFIGGSDALTWSQMREMLDSGLIDIQPHSQSHSNMGLQLLDESDNDYRQRIETEVNAPTRRIRQKLHNRLHTFAYPYGDTNDKVIELLRKADYQLAVTVEPGENPVFAYPYMLRRTMVFGDFTMGDFKRAIGVFQEAALK